MMHIIKWKSQPAKRGHSWVRTINRTHNDIEQAQFETPSLTDDFLKQNWDNTFQKATRDAEKEMNEKSKVDKLTWAEVFLNKYTLLVIIAAIMIALLV